jgi:hypothetical protein
MLSTKKGVGKLELCCDPKGHGRLQGAAHISPAGMTSAIINSCSKNASAAFLKQQGWGGKSSAGAN